MYTVPIIAPDLRHEETIIQAACALDCLQMTIDSVFERLDERIAQNTTRVKAIGLRITKAEERLRSLCGVKRALKIDAPSRFPATNVFRDLPLTFNMLNEDGPQQQQQQKLQQKEAQQKVLYEVVSPVESPQAAEAMQNKLVFFHVRSNDATGYATNMGGVTAEYIAASRTRVNCHGNNLGPVPQHISSADALLRFNSEEYAYSSCVAAEQQAQAKESWRRARNYKDQRQSGALQRKQQQQQYLEPAPHSLANRHQARATPSGELRYTPQMHEAPTIDLPLDLPTLEGVAVDIHFMGSTDMHSKITPSSALPTTEQTHEKIESEPVEVVFKSNLNAPSAAATVAAATTKTKSKKKQAPSAPTKATSAAPTPAPSIESVTATAPPPPPPPPPLALSQSISSQPSSTTGSDTRSALMDAIRKAGGTRGGGLRSAAAAPVDVVDTNKNQDNMALNKNATRNAVTSGGDLMADLHNKLLMRRKGISGNNSVMKNSANNSNINIEEHSQVKKRDMFMGNPVIQRLSALIPPPPQKSEAEQQQQEQRKHLQQRNKQHSEEYDDDANSNEDDGDWD